MNKIYYYKNREELLENILDIEMMRVEYSQFGYIIDIVPVLIRIKDGLIGHIKSIHVNLTGKDILGIQEETEYLLWDDTLWDVVEIKNKTFIDLINKKIKEEI